MDYINNIRLFTPANEQEDTDKSIILSYIQQYNHNVLFRENPIAHITSSGFLMNKQLDKVLLVHHNIRNVWAWTGGHADGDSDLLHVAIKEAAEETGVVSINPLSRHIASIDILPVFGHRRRGRYVNAHLHLSVAYLLICDEQEQVRPQLSENTDIAWFAASYFTKDHFDPFDTYLYNKLIDRALLLR